MDKMGNFFIELGSLWIKSIGNAVCTPHLCRKSRDTYRNSSCPSLTGSLVSCTGLKSKRKFINFAFNRMICTNIVSKIFKPKTPKSM